MSESGIRIRDLSAVRHDGDIEWFSRAMRSLLAVRDGGAFVEALPPEAPMYIARAPGRLDVMGGIADYSGSVVLEMPLACATYAIARPQPARWIDVESVRHGEPFRFRMDLDELLGTELRSSDALGAWFRERPYDAWAAYVIGCVQYCLTRPGVPEPSHGLQLLIASDVPEGKGVSSSAALEVASMNATAACYGITLGATELATACQWVENHIAGAPCGIMDQMSSALGQHNRLLRLRCQPATVEGHLEIPAGYRFYGIDSGIRHAVTGADYGTVRTAAFMGYRIVADLAGLTIEHDGPRVRVADVRWNGYLANISPDEFTARFADRLPERMKGDEFIARFHGTTDAVTRVDPGRWYPVRQATSHPVHENERVERFAELLSTGLAAPDVAPRMGALMFLSHASYTACGLGSDGTDLLIDLVGEAGPPRGLFGAKITGGGSGGTVAVLARESAAGVVREIAIEYERQTGRTARVFDGSGPGAAQVGVLAIDGK